MSDEEYFRDVLKILKIDSNDVSNVVRIGRVKERKQWLIKVTLRVFDTQIKILSAAKQLEVSKSNNVFISADLTRKQRYENKILSDEWKKRRPKGESNLIIRKGRIVTKN